METEASQEAAVRKGSREGGELGALRLGGGTLRLSVESGA